VSAVARTPVRVITPRRPGVRERVAEAWAYRNLLGYFARNCVEKLYRRTWLGWLWIPLRPILTVGSRVLVFGGLLNAPSLGKPYLLFFLVGTSTWMLFSQAALWATRSIELARRVLRRMYVPRLIVLFASAAPAVLNFLLYVAITLVAFAAYVAIDGELYLVFGARTLVALAGLALSLLLAFGIGLWTSVYGAQARDVRFGLGYALGFWYFLTPIIYPLSAVPSGFRTLAELNPMTAPVELVRYGVLAAGEIPSTAIASTLAAIAVLWASGLWFFVRSEAEALDSL
jgi:lipopolysaccharide transport system permease protein